MVEAEGSCTFSECASVSAAAASATGSAARGAVPLMGRASSAPPRPPRRKRSGDEQHTLGPPLNVARETLLLVAVGCGAHWNRELEYLLHKLTIR